MDALGQQYEAFALLAEDYCGLLEDESISGVAGLKRIHNSLLQVHAAAISLPEVEGSQHLQRTISHEVAWALYQSLQRRLPVDSYWDTFNPLEQPGKGPIASSLADDLADIWRDLKNGLIHLRSGQNQESTDVWWEWRFSFSAHWGAHAASALRVMYFALRDNA